MYGCESWTIKKAEYQRIDAFELWCWRRLWRVPWTARRSNQSILKEISPEYSSEGLMLKLKLQYFGHLLWRTDSSVKALMLGKIEGRRRRGHRGWDYWTASPAQWTWVWASSGSWWWTGKPGMLQSTVSERVRHNWATELNWARENLILKAYSGLESIYLISSWMFASQVQTKTAMQFTLSTLYFWLPGWDLAVPQLTGDQGTQPNGLSFLGPGNWADL